jgi:hypothetical protein
MLNGTPKKNVGAALIELQAQFAVGYIKLKQGMAGSQMHFGQFGYVPCTDDNAARIGIVLDRFHRLRNLIDGAALVVGPRSPLTAVNRAEIAVGVRPFVPDGYFVIVQIADVGVAAQKPQQFVDDRFHVKFFGREQRKSLAHRVSALMAENADGAGSGAIVFPNAFIQHALQ